MDTSVYTALTRQSGLMQEMQVVANNIANLSTTGFRREGMVFAEHVIALDDAPSLSMANGLARAVDLSQAGIGQTDGAFDLALQGDGFFKVLTPGGERLTRAGNFSPSAEGLLVTPEGFPLLDSGAAPIVVPLDGKITITADGALDANGQAIAQIGMWRPTDPLALQHQAGTLFAAGETELSTTSQINQGFLEDSNVNPISEISRMIEVQRAYEMGQAFLDAEDTRGRSTLQTLGK